MAHDQRSSTIHSPRGVMSVVRLMPIRASYDVSLKDDPEGRDFGKECAKRALENLAPWRLKKAKELMISLMTQGFSIEEVASACAISRSHFSRAFKNATGLAPHDWFRQEQIRKAQTLLRSRELSICCVAQECGFSDQSYFTRVFRQFNGISPRRWQLQHCGQARGSFNDASNA